MAWTSPVSRATGYLVTAARWNQDVVDNVIDVDERLTSLDADGAITTDKLADGAVTAAKLADSAIRRIHVSDSAPAASDGGEGDLWIHR